MTKTPLCNHPGCKFNSRSKGFCSKHGTKRVRIFCRFANCTAQCRGKDHLCYHHRLRQESDSNTSLTVIKKQIRQSCSTDECDKIARGKHGLCAKHYRLINNKSLTYSRKQPLGGEDTITPPVITILDSQIDALESKRQQIDLKINALNEKKKGLILIVPTLMEREPLADDDKQQSIQTTKGNSVVPKSKLAQALMSASTLHLENSAHSTNFNVSMEAHQQHHQLLSTTIDSSLVSRGRQMMHGLPIDSPSLYLMQQLSTTDHPPINSHAASVAATKEIVDLYSSSPESVELEETSTASPDLIVVKAKLKLAECKREEAELLVTLAQIEAKDKKGPTKKQAFDNYLASQCSDGQSKCIKVEKEVKVKIENEFWY